MQSLSGDTKGSPVSGRYRQLSTGWPSPAERRTAVLAGDLHDFGGDFLDLLLGQGCLGRGQGDGHRHGLLALADIHPFIEVEDGH